MLVQNLLKQEIDKLVERLEKRKAQKESSVGKMWGNMKE